MTGPDGSAAPHEQRRAIGRAMSHVADLVAAGHEVAITHGNGPQVGNILVKNELAAHVVPPVPLDWCGAQTQGTIGFTMLDALEASLGRRGVQRPVAAIVTRTLVDPDDPGFTKPTKPVGRYVSKDEAQPLIALGQVWEDRGAKGWRRVVASPEPLEVLDAHTLLTLMQAGYVVVAAGGGGIPVVRSDAATVHGVEAVIDKDLTSALLARQIGADLLVIVTGEPQVFLDFGRPGQRPVDRLTAMEARRHLEAGQFPEGSMGPKIEAALDFVAHGGQRAIITDRAHLVPRLRIVSDFVHQGQAADVESVMVDGRWIMRDGTVLTMDEATILREADRIARRAWAKLFAERPDLEVPPGFAPPPPG